MELKNYLEVLKKNWILIVLITLVAGFSAYFFTNSQKPIYEGGLTMMVSPVPKDDGINKNYYSYDGFYALQSSQLFTNNISSWLNSPDVVIDIYKQAKINIDASQVTELKTKISTTLRSAQSANNMVDALFTDSKKENITKLSDAAFIIIDEKVQQFNQSTSNKITYRVERLANPFSVEILPKVNLNTTIGLIGGFILGIFLAFLINYFQKSKSEQ